MRRAVARGRMFPQGYSTDRRYGRLSLKAVGLFPLMWANADDQGRLCGDPEEIKYAVCPNIDHITKTDIPELLKEIHDNGLIRLYEAPQGPAIQMLDWWHKSLGQHMQWAWPSDYSPPNGWQDHLRYKKNKKEITLFNWPVTYDDSGESLNGSQVKGKTPLPKRSGEKRKTSPLTTPSSKTKNEETRGRGRGISPDDSGEKATTATSGEKSPRSRLEAEETLCEGDREVISVWRSVKGFNMPLADASALVARLRTEFPDVDILAESKTWAARKLTEPLEKSSRPSQQIWNWMRLARKYAQERRDRGQGKGERVKVHPAEDYRGEW